MPRCPLFVATWLALVLAVGCSVHVPAPPPTATPIPPPTATPTPTAATDSARATGRAADAQARVSPPHGTTRRVTVENGVVVVKIITAGPTPTALERAIRSSGDTSGRRWDAADCVELAGQLAKGHKYGYEGLGGIVQYTDTLGGFVLNAWTFLPDEWLRHCAWRDYTMPPARPGR